MISVRLLLLIGVLSFVAPGHAQVLEQVGPNKRIISLGKTWGRNGQTAPLRLPFPHVTRKPASILITQQNTRGFQVTFVRADGNQVLPTNFGKDFDGLTATGELAPDYFLQVGTFDIDGDKTPEIVVAVGDGLVTLAVNVFKLSPTKTFTRVGAFEGQEKAILKRGTVILPYGSKGLFFEYQWKGGKFVQTNG